MQKTVGFCSAAHMCKIMSIILLQKDMMTTFYHYQFNYKDNYLLTFFRFFCWYPGMFSDPVDPRKFPCSQKQLIISPTWCVAYIYNLVFGYYNYSYETIVHTASICTLGLYILALVSIFSQKFTAIEKPWVTLMKESLVPYFSAIHINIH